MTSLSRICLATALLAGAAAPALAQTNYNWRPYATGGYVGLSVGRSDYQNDCGASLFCDSTRTAASVYTGTWVTPHLGLELGYLDMGSARRNGGDTRARGINLSVVGQVPLGNAFSAFGKIGTTYGRTETSADPSTGAATGDANGWGLSYGLGVSYDLTPQWALTLDWQRNRFNFAGGRDDVDATSLGVRYKF